MLAASYMLELQADYRAQMCGNTTAVQRQPICSAKATMMPAGPRR